MNGELCFDLDTNNLPVKPKLLKCDANRESQIWIYDKKVIF
jgi:hypothetical protein